MSNSENTRIWESISDEVNDLTDAEVMNRLADNDQQLYSRCIDSARERLTEIYFERYGDRLDLGQDKDTV